MAYYGANGKPEEEITVVASTTDTVITPPAGKTIGRIILSPPPTQEKTATPKASTQTIVPDEGKYLNKVVINGDSDLKAENIKKGVEIFGTTGTLEQYNPNGTEWCVGKDNEDFYNNNYAVGSLLFYANGVYLAPRGSREGIKYSIDGKTWDATSLTSNLYAREFWYDGGVYFARLDSGGTRPSAQYYCSSNGITDWTSADTRGVYWKEKNIWISNDLKYSLDGKTYTNSNLTNGNFNVVFNSNIAIAACNTKSSVKGIYYSTDGKIWTQSNITTCSYGFIIPVYGNNVWVINEYLGFSSSKFYYSTDNGKTWTLASSYSSSKNAYNIQFLNNLFIVNMDYYYYFYSSDGKNWTQTNISGVYNAPMLYHNNIYCLAGATSGYLSIWYSSNGKEYAKSASSNVVGVSLKYIGNKFVCGAGLSSNGADWTAFSFDKIYNSSAAVDGFYYGNNTYFVSGEKPYGLYYSKNGGASWQQSNLCHPAVYHIIYNESNKTFTACPGPYYSVSI